MVLPKRLRDSFHLKSGDKLAVEVRGDAIELRPTKRSVRLERVNGVLVLTGEMALPEECDLAGELRGTVLEELLLGLPACPHRFRPNPN